MGPAGCRTSAVMSAGGRPASRRQSRKPEHCHNSDTGLWQGPGMRHAPPQFSRRRVAAAALGAALLGLLTATEPAYSRVWVGFGFPLFWTPPVYYPPPIYYYPPPVYAPPPPAYYSPPPPAAYGPASPPGGVQSCYAGAYVCPMDNPVASGAACYCLGNQGTHVWGHAN